jgi:hypothetical protein
MDILPSGDDIASKIWDLLFGSLAEAIESAVDMFLGFSIEVFFTVENPYGSDAAFQAWMDSFEVALAIFPIMIILGLLSMPFADEQKTSLWRQGLRAVGVIVLIALSRPLIGFGVDFANILTHALMPDGGDLLDLMNPLNQMGNAIGLGLVYVLLGTKFFGLAAIALLVTLLLLQFRTFMIYVVYIMSPMLAVFWYADWGLLESVHEFANKFARMGIYSLLVGPIVAVIYRTLLVIGLSGFDSSFGSAEWVSAIWSQLVMTLLLPFLLIATVWKLISWAGEPLGVGNAITGALVAAGAALTAGAGALGGVAGGAGSVAGAGGGAGGAAGAGGGAAGAGSGAGAGAGPSASSMAQSAGGGGGSVGTGSSSSGGVGASGSATTANGGSLSDVVDEGQTVSASESEPAGGVSSGPGGGTGEPGGGPSDSATGMDDHSPSEPKGYMEGASERYQNWKSRNAQRIKNTAKKNYESAKDRFNPTNLQRRQAQNHRNAVEGLQENKEQFNNAINWNDAKHGTVDLQQANEAGALDANPAEGQDTAHLTQDGQFTYRGEDGETHRTSVGTTRSQFDESIAQHQQKAEQHEQRADSIDETLSKQEGRMKKTAMNQRKRQQAAGNAFFKEGVRGSIGAHSPYLMQSSGGGYGGNTVGGVTGGAADGVPNARSQPTQSGSEGGPARPEHSISPEQANEYSGMLSENGERFDLDQEVGYKPTGGSTPDGVAQQGKIVNPESGEEIMDVEVGEDAGFSLSQDETTRLGNVGVREGADGTKRLHADGNSRTFEENEMRGDEIIGNDDAAGQEATLKNATLREAPGEAENYEGQYLAEMENGEVVPVNAEDEEIDQHLQEHVGETGNLTGQVSREYGMSEDAHETHQGAHEYNALNISSSSESEAGTGEGADVDGSGGSGGSGGDSGSENGETAQASSGFGLYDEGGPSEPDSEPSVNNTLSPTRLNRGEANPTINNDRAVEGNVVEGENGGHALEDENTGERLSTDDINDPNNNITNDEGEFIGDIETGEQARVENVRVGADGSSIESTEATEVTTPTTEEVESEEAGSEGSSETAGKGSESSSSEGGDSSHEEGREGQTSSSHGFATADDDGRSGEGSNGSSRNSTTSASSSGHGFESNSEKESSSDSGGSETDSWGGPDTVSGEELVQADNSREDLPYKTSPEGQWVYEDTWNESEIEHDMYDGSDASADDVIAARGVLHEADENGTIKEDGASVGYVRFGTEHGLSESPAPEINGEQRDPEDGEVVEFDDDSGVKTRQWATEEGFNFADSRVQQSSAIDHGGEEGAVTTFQDGEEIEADPENQYIQVVPDEDSKLSSAGTTESPGGSASETGGESAGGAPGDSADAEGAGSETVSSGSPAGDATGGAEDVEVGSEESTTADISGSAEFEDGRIQHENLEGAGSREDLNGETADVEGTVGTNEYGNPTIEGEDSSTPLTDTTQTGAPELGSGQLENVSEGDSISASNARIETGGENDTVALSEESEVNTMEDHEGGVSVDFSGSGSQSEAEFGAETEAASSNPAEGDSTGEASDTVVDDTVSGSVSTPEGEEATVEKGESEGGSSPESGEDGGNSGSEAESDASESDSVNEDLFGGSANESAGGDDDPFLNSGSESANESNGASESSESMEVSTSETQSAEEATEEVGSNVSEPEESGTEETSLDVGEGGSQQSPEIEDNEPEVEKEFEDAGGEGGEQEPEGSSTESGSSEGASQSEIDESTSETDLEDGEIGAESPSEQESHIGGGDESESNEESGASFEGDPFEDISTESSGGETTSSESGSPEVEHDTEVHQESSGGETTSSESGSAGVEHDTEVHQEGGEYESGDFEAGDVELGDREDGDFETGDVEQRESHEGAGGDTASHDAGAEQNIDPETGTESEVVEESEQPEEPEEGEEDENESEGDGSDDEDGDDGEGGGVSTSGGDDHDGGGSGNESGGGESSTSAEAATTTNSESGSGYQSGEELGGGGHEAEMAGGEKAEGDWEERARNWREHTDESESESETVDENAGFTAEAMDVETLDDGERVFITDYDELNESMDDDDIMNTLGAEELRHRALAGQQWTEEMGQEPPETAFNEDTNEIIQQEAGSTEKETWAVDEAPDEALEKVDREEYEETMAVQMLGGNIDVGEDNVHVDEEGGLHVIDFDRSGAQMGKFDDAREMEISAGAAGRVGEEIGKVNEDFHEDSRKYEGQVTNKANEIATELEESGQTDEVLSPVEEIDEDHSEHSDPVAPVIRHNIESLSDDSVEVKSTSGASQEEIDEVFNNLEEKEGEEESSDGEDESDAEGE